MKIAGVWKSSPQFTVKVHSKIKVKAEMEFSLSIFKAQFQFYDRVK